MNDTGVSFVHQKSNRLKRVRISIASDGTIIVTTPPFVSTRQAAQFVQQSRAWILVHQQQVKSKPVLLSKENVLYMGKSYVIRVLTTQDGSVQLKEQAIFLSPIRSGDHALMIMIEHWLQARASEYIVHRVHELAKQMHVTFADVKFKQQKTRWGSCSSSKNLNFNWRLIHAPTAVIDYVIIHELAHTVHMNHGRQFWDLVARYDPDHPLHRGWLKRYGSTAE